MTVHKCNSVRLPQSLTHQGTWVTVTKIVTLREFFKILYMCNRPKNPVSNRGQVLKYHLPYKCGSAEEHLFETHPSFSPFISLWWLFLRNDSSFYQWISRKIVFEVSRFPEMGQWLIQNARFWKHGGGKLQFQEIEEWRECIYEIHQINRPSMNGNLTIW